MAFSIDNFRKKGLADGGSRPNLFSAQITKGPTSSVTGPDFPFLCKIATIPPSTMGVVEVPYFGRMVKVPGNRTFDNLSITIINDESMDIRDGFERWMDMMNSHKTNETWNTNILGTLVVTDNIRSLNSSGDKKWTFNEIFPVALGEIGLDWGSNDTIEEFTVDLAYDYWESSQTT